MPFMQELSLEILACAYFINFMFLVGALALNVPIYTPFDVSTTVNGVAIPNALQVNYTNNLKTNMTSNIGNITTTNPLQIALQANPFAFMQYVYVFISFITGTFFFNVAGNFLTGTVAQAFYFGIAGFVIFCLGRTVLFYTRGV